MATQIALLVIGATLLFHAGLSLAVRWSGSLPEPPPFPPPGDCAPAEMRGPPPPPPPHGPPPHGPPPLFIILGGMTVVIMPLLIWAARRVTTPLAHLAESADRLGREGSTAPVAEEGPDEVRRAARAFNLMQERLRRFVDDRTRMLAAISHDYRTVLTRLRLRVEGVADEGVKGRLLDDLTLMDSMVASTLAFVRGAEMQEVVEWVDLPSLLRTVCDQFADLGHAVSYDGPPAFRFRCRVQALQGAIANLVDNGTKYADSVVVSLSTAAEQIRITVADDGPGIPAAARERVFEPFYRLDEARRMDTGGVGLGLSIARSVVAAHGGEIRLSDNAPRGLAVRVSLPIG
jgi:signal transduction histidine kinase